MEEIRLSIPEFSLVVLVGVSGSGKSTFARRHFLPTEILSSDFCRGLVADDENDQSASNEAFDVLHYIAGKRLAARRLTVVDATNVQKEARRPLIHLAREYHALPVAIVLDVPERTCRERNETRPDRDFGAHVTRIQARQLRRSLRELKREGFNQVHVLSSPEKIAAVRIERVPLWVDRTGDHGPFDIIGDVHGCIDELRDLLERLGYEVTGGDSSPFSVLPPEGRKAVFLGDLVDRGPGITGVLRLVMGMVKDGTAYCLPGNHDMKVVRYLRGRRVKPAFGLPESIEQLSQESDEFRGRVAEFLDGLVSHYVLDEGKLVVAHAGMKESLQRRASRKVREFALYGETTGETDEFGLPVRYNWAAEYRGRAMVVYGHTPVLEPEWVNHTINIDTGCVFGGKLTALRYPEGELVSVPAAKVYCEPAKPLDHNAGNATRPGDLLDINDVAGKRQITTRLRTRIGIHEERAAAALEVMSRFAIDPHWLIYLPPTMSPSETSRRPGLLEHPDEAFGYYRERGITRVVCQEKHMGSRSVVIVGRDDTVARERFGTEAESAGVCYTRTGRRFFDDEGIERELIRRLRAAVDRAGLWDELSTDWLCLDCELMPWSAKARELLIRQYAPVGNASRRALSRAADVLEAARARGIDLHFDGDGEGPSLLERYRDRREMVGAYAKAYRRYCWPVNSLDDVKLAPFHVLAAEPEACFGKDHVWHMSTIGRMCEADGGNGLLFATPYRVVDLEDETSVREAVDRWETRTNAGGEGMVVKPYEFVAEGERDIVQPALKCRGREYLRIIYGPEYTDPKHLERLRKRGLGRKRSLAIREFALGVEALERFVRREPLFRVHECVFGVLALESEPVDPRL